MWLYGCIDAIPFYLFVAAVAFSLKDGPLQPWGMHIAMIATFWSSTCRIVRGEVIKIRSLEYIQAAKAVGVGPLTIVRRHVMPNTTHILLVQSTIAFVGAIKSEVILTFLGLGVVDGVSWGTMLSESTSDVLTRTLRQLPRSLRIPLRARDRLQHVRRCPAGRARPQKSFLLIRSCPNPLPSPSSASAISSSSSRPRRASSGHSMASASRSERERPSGSSASRVAENPSPRSRS